MLSLVFVAILDLQMLMGWDSGDLLGLHLLPLQRLDAAECGRSKILAVMECRTLLACSTPLEL